MFDKNFLVSKVVNSLQNQNYDVLTIDGCFEIAAKRKKNLFLIKVLTNVDALKEEHAMSLRAISYFLSAYPLVISIRNSRETLEDGVVYSRYEVPVITPKLFENFLIEEEIPVVQSAKGRHTVEIDAEVLRARRKELKFTLDDVAKIAGISKKALYEIENKRVNPSEDTVKRLEKILSVDLKLPYVMKSSRPTYLRARNNFQQKVSSEFRRIGIDNSSVYSAPFEIVGKENFSVILTLSQNTAELKKEARTVKNLSTTFSSQAVFIAKKSKEESIEGVPVVLESDLAEIESSKELKKLIEEK